MKDVRLRELARHDIEAVVDHCASEGGEALALRFVNAVERALRLVGVNPSAGSPRFSYELQLPGLRARSLMGFPYLVFYVESDDHIDVWRVLHGHRDLPAWLLDPRP
jgi:toxin ParE1/3/4